MKFISAQLLALFILQLTACTPGPVVYQGEIFRMPFVATRMPTARISSLHPGPSVSTRYCRVLGTMSATDSERKPIFDTLIQEAIEKSGAELLRNVEVKCESDPFADDRRMCFTLEGTPLLLR